LGQNDAAIGINVVRGLKVDSVLDLLELRAKVLSRQSGDEHQREGQQAHKSANLILIIPPVGVSVPTFSYACGARTPFFCQQMPPSECPDSVRRCPAPSWSPSDSLPPTEG